MPELREYLPYGVLLVLILRDLVVEWGLLRVLREALQRAQDHLPTAPVVPPPPPSVAAPSQKPPPLPPPAADIVVDQGLADFGKKQEGYSSKAYWDYKQWTIGYGTRANSSTEVIDEAEATRRFVVELDAAYKAVEAFIPNAPKGVKQGMTDATYNLGSGWQQQELGQLLKAGKYEEAKSHLLQYNHAGGQVLEALTKRRQAEVNMFDNPL